MNLCPSCGSKKINESRYANEYVCSECLTEFNPTANKVYKEFSYSNFCESVSTIINEKMHDANLGSSIKEIIESYVNESPKQVTDLIDRLTVIAEDLYNDYKMDRREKYDFGALIEGINRLNEFADIQVPGVDDSIEKDETPIVPDVGQLPDPMAMVDPNTDKPEEVEEHSALEKLKNAICTVQTALQALEDSESNENSGIQAIPNLDNDVVTSGDKAADTLNSGISDIEEESPVGVSSKSFRKTAKTQSPEQLTKMVLQLASEESLGNHGLPVEAKIQLDPTSQEAVNSYSQLPGYQGRTSNPDGSIIISGGSKDGEWRVKVTKEVNELEPALEGMNDASINMPTMAAGGPGVDIAAGGPGVDIDDMTANSIPNENESPGHEHEEQGAIADLKAGLSELQAAYAEYIGSEVKVHGDNGEGSVDGTTPEQGIGAPLKSPELADKINALSNVNDVDNHTLFEKVKEVMESFTVKDEDAQLVSNTWVDKDLKKSIDVDKAELSTDENVLSEARPGENDIQTQVIKKPVKEEGEMSIKDLPESVQPENGETPDLPGEVNEPVDSEDEKDGFSVVKENDYVLYENQSCVVTEVQGKFLTICNESNGHVISVLAEDVESANTEDLDIRGERMEEGTNALLSAWQKIEKKMNLQENLNAPKRNYDLRTKKVHVLNEEISPETAALTAPAPVVQHPNSTPAKIDSYDHKGKKVIRLVAENGLKVEIVPAMTNKGPRFFFYLDGALQKTLDGKQFWDLNAISQKLSNLSSQGVNMQDIAKLTTKLEVLQHHMENPKAESAAYNTAPELSEAGYQFFEDESSISYINESIDESLKEDEETNSNISIPTPEDDKNE